MEEIKELLSRSLNIDFLSATLSNPRGKEEVMKVKVRPILHQGGLMFQCEEFRGNQVFHYNYEAAGAAVELERQMQQFRQLNLETKSDSYQVLVSKKGKVTVKRKVRQDAVTSVDLSHDRKKNYILQEGTDIPFLKDLGVLNAEGKIIRSRFDKFRQINRFLEFIEDVLPHLDKERENTILDFGCGKSYLTFAMYYYLHEIKGYNVRIIGLDLKKVVVENCRSLGLKYGYEKLTFLEGDIAGYEGCEKADMVVTLHACDTATDHALYKAVSWGAKVILSVPCCQHEVNGQIKNDVLGPLLSYGLIKERMAALVTDAMRAQYLEGEGYETQILEFIDMEHTPKNILIRAVKTGKRGNNHEALKACEKFLHVSPTLGKLLKQ